jgi:hypothetical protein
MLAGQGFPDLGSLLTSYCLFHREKFSGVSRQDPPVWADHESSSTFIALSQHCRTYCRAKHGTGIFAGVAAIAIPVVREFRASHF